MTLCDANNNSVISLPQHLTALLKWSLLPTENPELGSVYVYNLVEQRLLCASCSLANILGYTPRMIRAMNRVELTDLVHADDRLPLVMHAQQLATLQYRQVITIAYRMKRADGTWCRLSARETPFVMGSDGLPMHLLGTIQDQAQLSQTKQRENLLRRFLQR